MKYSLTSGPKYVIRYPMDITSRSEAKERGLDRYFTGKPCVRGHIIWRNTKSGVCSECNREKAAHFRSDNPERSREINTKSHKKHYVKIRAYDNAAQKIRYWSNPDKARADSRIRCKRWRDKNPNYGRDQMRDRRVSNPEKMKKQRQDYYVANIDKIKERGVKYRAANREKLKRKRHAYYLANIEQWRVRACRIAAADAIDSEKIKLREQRALAATPEKRRERKRAYRAANREKSRKYGREYYKTPLGRLRAFCKSTFSALEGGKLGYSKLSVLDYDQTEFIRHLESTLYCGMSFEEARKLGYHIDHIIPLSFISNVCSDDKEGRLLAFRVAQDLKNLRMIPGGENVSKHNKMEFDSIQERVFDHLCDKYDIRAEMVAAAI